MELTIKSSKLGKSLTFFYAGNVFVNTNGKEGTLGEQICKGGFTNSGSCIHTTEENFEKVCRAWLRQYIQNQEALSAGEF